MAARRVLQAGYLYRVGDGSSINIWEDNWIAQFPSHIIQDYFTPIVTLVHGLINHELMTWNAPMLSSIFPEDVVHQILCIPYFPLAIMCCKIHKLEIGKEKFFLS